MICANCKKLVEPWRESQALCARCARDQNPHGQTRFRNCSRCGEAGHNSATCLHPPWEYQGEYPAVVDGYQLHQGHRQATDKDCEQLDALIAHGQQRVAMARASLAQLQWMRRKRIILVTEPAAPEPRQPGYCAPTPAGSAEGSGA